MRLDDGTIRRLLEVARDAAARAYAPYSSFPVGAAVLTADDTIVPGANIENASYGLTVCGERAAVFTAVADGHREIRAVAVSAPKAPGTTPCGACRQVLDEFRSIDTDTIVIVDNGEGESANIVTLTELLPRSFRSHDFKERQ
ncbi:MAG TPA: cytidine deaminase [Thermomicrobiales bacterium]|nr:cytidine deaminase [Thermomicrobiales bacterium]